jgi:hypothetical protein
VYRETSLRKSGDKSGDIIEIDIVRITIAVMEKVMR